MAIQIPNPGTGNGATGDNEFVLWSKVKDNFSDQTNAASRLVGTAAGQVPLAEHALKASYTAKATVSSGVVDANTLAIGELVTVINDSLINGPNPPFFDNYSTISTRQVGDFAGAALFQEIFGYNSPQYAFRVKGINGWRAWEVPYTTRNATKDANGFLKGASPIAEIYSDKMDLNHDATEQGGITFEKLGVGDYLIKGSLGFAQEGWYIETPKDANGNVLVAVVYEQLANNDISVKTYAKRFDDDTGDIVANLAKPRDIPNGRFISLRLHEIPVEIEDDIQMEV